MRLKLNFHFSSFRERILVTVALVVIFTQLLSFALFDYAAMHNARQLIISDLKKVSGYFGDVFQQHLDRLTEGVVLLAGDFAFKTAVATFDRETVRSALLNYQLRNDADIMAIVDADGRYIAATFSEKLYDQTAEFVSAMVLKVEDSDEQVASGVTYFDQKGYQIIVVPVKAPHTIAYAIAGFSIDEAFAQNFKDITSADITFTLNGVGESSEAMKVITTTVRSFDSLQFLGKEKVQGGALIGPRYDPVIRQSVVLGEDEAGRVFTAVLERSWQELFQEYTSYRVFLVILTSMILAICVPFALLIAHRMVRSVEILIDGAQRVAEGDYSVRIETDQQDELGLLAERFNDMVMGLVERERMEFLAYHDGLTGLGNRRLLKKEIDKVGLTHKRTQKPAVLFMIDLDNFKPINDTYGHDAGDITLIQVARRLDSVTSSDDEVAIRLGGDEFALLLREGADSQKFIEEKAQTLLESICEPIRVTGGKYIHVGASIGIAFYRDDLRREDWIKEADKACYAAKDAGKNTYKVYRDV